MIRFIRIRPFEIGLVFRHGTFDDQAKSRSLLFELDRRRGPLAVAVGLGAVAAAVLSRNGKD